MELEAIDCALVAQDPGRISTITTTPAQYRIPITPFNTPIITPIIILKTQILSLELPRRRHHLRRPACLVSTLKVTLDGFVVCILAARIQSGTQVVQLLQISGFDFSFRWYRLYFTWDLRVLSADLQSNRLALPSSAG
jgi:hypothetical protein